jgi:hypothetical protein
MLAAYMIGEINGEGLTCFLNDVELICLTGGGDHSHRLAEGKRAQDYSRA